MSYVTYELKFIQKFITFQLFAIVSFYRKSDFANGGPGPTSSKSRDDRPDFCDFTAAVQYSRKTVSNFNDQQFLCKANLLVHIADFVPIYLLKRLK